MKKKEIKVSTKNEKNGSLSLSFEFPEDMTGEEQIKFFMQMADVGLLPPYPKEIKEKYGKSENNE